MFIIIIILTTAMIMMNSIDYKYFIGIMMLITLIWIEHNSENNDVNNYDYNLDNCNDNDEWYCDVVAMIIIIILL